MLRTGHLFAFAALLIFVAFPAAADPDCEIGVFFDEAGTLRGIDAVAGSVAHAYLILSPTDGPVSLTRFNQVLEAYNADGTWLEARGGGANIHASWGGSDLSMELIWTTPFTVDGPVVVADLYIPVDTADTIIVYAECSAFCETELGGTMTWTHCTHCDLMPPSMTVAATINSEWVPVGNETTTWSAVKAIYR